MVKPLPKGGDMPIFSGRWSYPRRARAGPQCANGCRDKGTIGALARRPNSITLKFPAQGSGKNGKGCDEKGGSKKVSQKNGFKKTRQENGREKICEEICKKKSLGKWRLRKRVVNVWRVAAPALDRHQHEDHIIWRILPSSVPNCASISYETQSTTRRAVNSLTDARGLRISL
jgi:hypothetical protein